MESVFFAAMMTKWCLTLENVRKHVKNVLPMPIVGTGDIRGHERLHFLLQAMP